MTIWMPYKLRDIQAMLTERDVEILLSLERFRLLGTRQLQRLHFGQGHATTSAATRGTIRVMGRLERHGLVARLERRIGGVRQGSAGTVWQLATTGERFLRALRGEPKRRRFVEPGPSFVNHTLAVSEVAVRLIEATRVSEYEILELATEPDCWRSFQGASGAAEWLKPDLLVVTADATSEAHAYVEVDRATEHLPAVIRKCLVYQRYYRSGADQAERGVFPLVLWIAPNERRAERIRQAIAEEERLDARLFLVTTQAEVITTVLTGAPAEQAAPTSSPNRKEETS